MASIGARVLAFFALALGLVAPLSAQSGDEADIHALVRAQEAALNAHDASAYGQFLAPDADMVTSLGWRVQGRDSYTQKLAGVFRGSLGKAHFHADDIAITSLAPDVALIHITWSDTTSRKGGAAIESQVLRRVGGRWLIAASQETIVAPEKAAEASPDAPAATPQPARKCLVANRDGKCLVYR